jgi:MFS family permease
MAFIDGTVVNVALPVLQSTLGATVSQVQWVVESYALFLAALLLPGGSLGDLYGRRKTFEVGVVVFGLASAWCDLAPNVLQLIAARALQGVGGRSSRACSRNFMGANLLTLFLYAAFSGVLFFFRLNLMQIQKYSLTEAGAALLCHSSC